MGSLTATTSSTSLPTGSSSSTSSRSPAIRGTSKVAQQWRSCTDAMATLSCSTDALTWLFITTANPAWSFLSTPPRVVSSPPGLPTQTGTSRCSRSSTARSRDGATTLTRSRSSKRSGGRLAPDLATRMEEALSSASPDLHVPMRLGGVAWRVAAADVDLAAVVPHPTEQLHAVARRSS